MITIINRSALVSMGANPAPDVASIVEDYQGRQVVKWSDVLQARRDRQRDILAAKRLGHSPVRAYRLSVLYYDQRLMGGWQAFIDGIHYHAWIDRDRKWIIPQLMELFPPSQPRLCPQARDWLDWKIEFARRFERRKQDRRPVGVQHFWWDEQHQFRRVT